VATASRSLATFLLGLLTLAGGSCSRRPIEPPPPPALAWSPSAGLRVSLTWSGPADLDLYVTDPTWESIYFANTPGRSGGKLERDARCRDLGSAGPTPLIEWATFENPPAGSYRIGVDYIESCDDARAPLPFRVVVEYGEERVERVGLARHLEFRPIVLEFDLKPGAPARSLEEIPEKERPR
jgi:hypothetical protein